MIKILEFFISNLNELKPEESRLLEEGYSISYINEIYNTEYKLQKIDSKKVNTLIEDFLLNYDRSKFRIRNVFFNDTIETELINNHVIFGSIEGGYISFNEQRNFFLSYAEDIEGTITMLCENDTQFFDILLLVAKYSTLTYVGEISDDDEDEKEKYIAMCNDIYFCELNSALFE